MKPFMAFGLVVVLSGCTSVDAVRDVSTRLSSASETWDDVGGDIYGSCQRESSVNPALADCNLEKDASSGLAAVNAVLAGYFKALADAANGTHFTIQPGLDQATTSVAKIPDIRADQVKAVSGLFSLLMGLETEAAREATLRDLIEKGGPPAQTVIKSLDGLVVPRLARRLDTERAQLTGRFGRLILAQRDPAGDDPSTLCAGAKASTFSGTGYLLTLEYCRRLVIVDERAKALADYRASLSVADKAMTELQSAKSKLGAKGLAQKLYGIGLDLNEKVSEVRKAFA